jgi:hypothetical protein
VSIAAMARGAAANPRLRRLKGPAKAARRAVHRARALPVEMADRRLRPRLAHDPAGPVLVLSPHHDDAIFNCWSILDGPGDVRVVNVFAGSPPAGALSDWDRICGARDSAAQVRARLEEDRAALALAGRLPLNLDFPDLVYRRSAPPPSLAAIDAALAEAVPACSAVLAPVGSEHDAHVVLRRYAELLTAAGVPVELYAEVPYMTRLGWPHWVTGSPADPHLDLDAYWSWNPAIPGAEGARVVALAPERAAAKLAAMRAYRSQFTAVDGGALGMISNPAIHGFEVFWPQPAS